MKEIKDTIKGADYTAKVGHSTNNVANLTFDNGFRCEIGSATCGHFSEDTALTKKIRLHRKDDHMEISADLQRIIPFGKEYELKRTLVFGDGFARVTVDAACKSGGKLDNLELEPITFHGSWKEVGLDDGEDVKWFETSDLDNIVYNEDKPLLRIFAVSTSGAIFETGCGEDLWRHDFAKNFEGCKAQNIVEISKFKVTIKRVIIDFDKEMEESIPKRPWRLSYYIAWSLRDEKVEDCKTIDINSLDIHKSGMCSSKSSLCLSAPATRRRLRDTIRATSESILISGVKLDSCNDPSHLERPGKGDLKHWGIAELLSLYLWGNRFLNKNGLSVTFKLEEKSAIAKVLQSVPRKFIV